MNKSMKSIFAVASAVALIGCTSFKTLNEGLPYLVDQPIDTAVNVLGLPDEKLKVGPYSVYVWSHRAISAKPAYETNSATNYVPVEYQCQIKLQVDESDVIKRWEWNGNRDGCEFYSGRVGRLIRK